jgi:hypothetical protein
MVSRSNYSREYGQAEKAYLESNFAQAVEIINHLAEEFLDDPNILLLRGHIYCYGFQNYNLAIQQYKRALKLTKEQDLLNFALSGIEQIEQLQQQSENLELSSKNSTQESLNQTKMTNNPQGDENKKKVVTQGFIDKLIDKIGKILKEQHALVERDEEQAEELESLLHKVSSIENDFEELTKSLAKGSYPLKLARSIKVTQSLLPIKIEPITISKSQLIATYNELVAVLSGYIIPVTLTPDSYRDKNSDGIILETTVKGNYWTIATLENKQHQYWLVPNNNISFNIHKLKTVESLFQLKGDYDSPNSDFILEEPAVLSLLPDNKQWKLLQPGILLFGSNLKSISPQEKKSVNVADDEQYKITKQMLSTLAAFQTKVEQLNNKITQFEIQSELSQKTYQRDKQEWLSEKQALNQQLQKTDVLQSQLTNFINQSDRIEEYKLQQNLPDADLAIVKSLKVHFENMADIVRHYHSDHHASKEEADLIGNCLLKASKTIDNTKTNSDLIKLFEYLIALKGKLSQYNHKEHKYRWSVILENGVLCKLQQISVLQDYQRDKLDVFFIQQPLERQIQNNVNANTVKSIESVSDNHNKINNLKNQNSQDSKIDLKTKISQFRQAYSQDTKLISDKIVAKVAITVETLEQIIFNKPDVITLENTQHGKYWIIDYLDAYFLIPSEIDQITKAQETSSNVAKILFYLAGYYPEYSSCYLIRPAIVTKLSMNQWKLEEKGKFNFS